MAAGEIRIGCSGWVYKHWRERFYPKEVPQRSWFDYYAQQFNTVEINNSFYHLPTPGTFDGWRAKAPEGFRFAVKGNRFITHLKRLKDPDESVKRFFDSVDKLGAATGPILWQLSPSFHRDDERLATFLEALPRGYRHTFEFRHTSWLDPAVYELLGKHHAALCIPDRPDLPRDIRCTSNWSYIRMHSSNHDDGLYNHHELGTWAHRIREFTKEGADVWVYFDNDQEGFAIENARYLTESLGI